MAIASACPWRFSVFFINRKTAHALYALTPNVCGEQRPETIPPQPYSLVTKIDAALEKQIFDIAQRQRNPMYIMTTRRITSGDERKYRNRLAHLRGLSIYLLYPANLTSADQVQLL